MMMVCLINAITMTIVISFLVLSLKFPKNKKKLALFLFLCAFLFSIVKTYLEGTGAFMIVFAPLLFLSLTFGVKKILKATIHQTLTICGLYFLISIAGDTIAVLLLREGMGLKILAPEGTAPGFFIALCLTNMIQIMFACLYAWKTMKHIKRQLEYTDDMECLTILVIITQFSMFCVIWVFRKEIYDYEKIKFILLSAQILFSLIAVCLFLMSRHDEKIGEMQREINAAEQRNEAFYQYYQEQENNEKRLRQLNHDFNNLMAAALGMAEKGEYERAAGLFQNMEQYCQSEDTGE